MKTPDVPEPTLRRLPLYYRELKRAIALETDHLSSKELGESVGIPAVQVRKDLSYLDEKGRPGVGYETRTLAAHLEMFLGLTNDKEAALVGVGNLGRALALFPGFAAYGFHIVLLFDNDPAKVGRHVGKRKILPIEKLTDIVAQMHIHLGIITAPAEVAQDVADAMVTAGIKTIWNFAPRSLAVPEGVFVKNEDLAVALATLSRVVERFKTTEQTEEKLNA